MVSIRPRILSKNPTIYGQLKISRQRSVKQDKDLRLKKNFEYCTQGGWLSSIIDPRPSSTGVTDGDVRMSTRRLAFGRAFDDDG